MRCLLRRVSSTGIPRAATTVFVLALMLCAPYVQALTTVKRSFDELVTLSDAIVTGTAVSAQAVRSADGHNIRTVVSFTDLDVLKGEVPSAPFEFPFPGGVLGDEAQLYPGVPGIESGARYVLFIKGAQTVFLPLVGAEQGLFRVLRDAGGTERVLRADAVPRNATGAAMVPADARSYEDFRAAIAVRLSRP